MCSWVQTPNLLQPTYKGSSIIGTLVTVILAIPGFIKNSKYFDYRDFLLKNPCNTGIPIIEDLDFFQLLGTFSGPSHPDNRGPAIFTFFVLMTSELHNILSHVSFWGFDD